MPITWNEKLFMFCRKCGTREPWEPPFDLDVYTKELKAFSELHKNCKPTASAIALLEDIKSREDLSRQNYEQMMQRIYDAS